MSLEISQSLRYQLRGSRYITRFIQTSEKNVIVVWFISKLLLWISRVSIYYGTKSNIRVKSYCRLNFLSASVLNFECLDILQDSIGHLSKKLLSFGFTQSFCSEFQASRYTIGTIGHPIKNLSSFQFSHCFYFQFRASRYITGINRTSELKVIVVWICYEHLFSITSVSIYHRAHSDIRVESYCRLNLVRASVVNYMRLDVLWDSFGHPSQKLLSFDFAQGFYSEFQVSRYTTGHNRTSE